MEKFQDHSGCIACGQTNPFSLNLHFSTTTDGQVAARFQASTLLQGYTGILHGGVISLLLDSAMTHCLFARGIKAVTAELKVKFIHSVPCSAALLLQAQLIQCRQPLYKLTACLYVDETPHARAAAKFMRDNMY